MSTDTQNNAPVSSEPVYQPWSDEGFGGWTGTDQATYRWWLGSKNPPRMRKLYTAPVAAQHAATLSSIGAFVACDASAISYLILVQYRTALLKMLRQAKPQTMETE